MRFTGDYAAKIDAKGRVFFPAPFRRQLEQCGEQRMILRPDLFQPCLVLYTEALWNNMLDTMRSHMNPWNGTHQDLMRRFVAEAEVVELDSNGRFLMTKRKLQYAGIRQEVRFMAVYDHIEVWDKERCDAHLSEQGDLGAALQEIMSEGNGNN